MERGHAARARQRARIGAPCSEEACRKRRIIAIEEAMADGQEALEKQVGMAKRGRAPGPNQLALEWCMPLDRLA